jgi:Domain of unknown function (DUF1937)
MIYLASPYSSPDFSVQEARFEATEYFTAYWLKLGAPIFSPIVYCHRMALIHKMPTDFAFWREFNLKMLNRATDLWVLKLDGWQVSAGVQAEIKAAMSRNLPVAYHDPV